VTTLRSFLLIWLATLPFVLIGHYGWVAAPALSVTAFLFLTVEQMAIEIEQPFGYDANDLPIEKYILELETTIYQLLPRRQRQGGGDARGGIVGDGSEVVLKAAPAPRTRVGSAFEGIDLHSLSKASSLGSHRSSRAHRPAKAAQAGVDEHARRVECATSGATMVTDPVVLWQAPPMRPLTATEQSALATPSPQPSEGELGSNPAAELSREGPSIGRCARTQPAGATTNVLSSTEELLARYLEVRQLVGDEEARLMMPSTAAIIRRCCGESGNLGDPVKPGAAPRIGVAAAAGSGAYTSPTVASFSA
jgi:hypothetical protein